MFSSKNWSSAVREKRFKVVFSPAAVRDIDGLEVETAVQIVKDIKTYLETLPIPIGKSRLKKLTGFNPPLFRMRSGDFRAYYRLRGDEVVILVVTRRKDSDKRLKRIAEGTAPAFSRTKRPVRKH